MNFLVRKHCSLAISSVFEDECNQSKKEGTEVPETHGGRQESEPGTICRAPVSQLKTKVAHEPQASPTNRTRGLL